MCVCEDAFDMVYWNETIGCIDAYDCPCEDNSGGHREVQLLETVFFSRVMCISKDKLETYDDRWS